MILGFGTQEKQAAIEIINECYEEIQKDPEKANTRLEKVSAKYKDADKKYSDMGRNEAPYRYTYFYANYYKIYDKKYLVQFTFHHINRRHAMSPDGWALLQTKWMLSVEEIDGKIIYRES